MVPVIREFLGKEEVERRETFDWVEPVGREDVDDEDLELYDTLTVRRKKAADLEIEEEDRGLYELLGRIRLDLAKDAGWPPYCIMTNRALRAVVSRKPLTVEDFKAIPGISARLCNKSGELFVSAIMEYLKD